MRRAKAAKGKRKQQKNGWDLVKTFAGGKERIVLGVLKNKRLTYICLSCNEKLRVATHRSGERRAKCGCGFLKKGYGAEGAK